MTAYEWGVEHGACYEATAWLKSLGDATQADAYRVCRRGDWLLWALDRLPRDQYPSEAVWRALDRIVARAIRRGQRALRGIRSPEATAWRRWARRWLSGEDRSRGAASDAAATAALAAAWAPTTTATAAWASWAAARASWGAARAAWAAARAASTAAWTAERDHELLLQVRDIRREIPEWPGGER